MGGGAGGGYRNSESALQRNINVLAKRYPLNQVGKFGVKGDNKAQVLLTSTPSKTAIEFIETLKTDGQKKPTKDPTHEHYLFPGYGEVYYRPETKTGGPGITFKFPDLAYKLHFEVPKKKG